VGDGVLVGVTVAVSVGQTGCSRLVSVGHVCARATDRLGRSGSTNAAIPRSTAASNARRGPAKRILDTVQPHHGCPLPAHLAP
jgi:hypothetical protein